MIVKRTLIDDDSDPAPAGRIELEHGVTHGVGIEAHPDECRGQVREIAQQAALTLWYRIYFPHPGHWNHTEQLDDGASLFVTDNKSTNPNDANLKRWLWQKGAEYGFSPGKHTFSMDCQGGARLDQIAFLPAGVEPPPSTNRYDTLLEAVRGELDQGNLSGAHLALSNLRDNPALTTAEIREHITSAAHDLGPKGHDTLFGAGRADALGALKAVIGSAARRPLTAGRNPSAQQAAARH